MAEPTPVTPVEPIISFKGVNKAFGSNVIFEGLNLDIYRGETLTIIGGSGTGKSVTLKMLIRLLRADEGSITAFGEEVTTMKPKALLALRRRIAMLFQGAALFDSLTVAQNIKYPLIEHGWKDEDKMTARVREVLDQVGLGKIEDQKPASLSGGMKKRVGLARAIAIKPDVILYDEPTTGLDPINVRRINGLIRHLQESLGVTSIVVTHDMDSCFTVTDRLAFLYNKRIEWVGPPEAAREAPLEILREFVKGGSGILEDDLYI